MAIEGFSEEEVNVIGECLTAAVEGPFFPDWEFPLLFGLERAEVAAVMRAWPNVRVNDCDVDLAINNAIGNLLYYPHGEELGDFVSASPERLLAVLQKWKAARASSRP